MKARPILLYAVSDRSEITDGVGHLLHRRELSELKRASQKLKEQNSVDMAVCYHCSSLSNTFVVVYSHH